MVYFFKQLALLFQRSKTKKKVILFSIALLALATLLAPLIMTKYRPLFPHHSLSPSESREIKQFLDKNGVRYRQKEEEQLIVSAREVEKLENEIHKKKFLQKESQVGFELFDTNTWIKGEQELQMLEMRALKGELERDLASFENVKKANVIVDMAPHKLFGSTKYKTKASVILTLQEEALLSHSQLCAIVYHLSGAVHGLEPSMVAI